MQEIFFVVTDTNYKGDTSRASNGWTLQYYSHGYLDSSLEPMVNFTLNLAPQYKRATLHNLATALIPIVKEFYADE